MYLLPWLLFLRICGAVLETRGHDRFSFFLDRNINSKTQHDGFMSFATLPDILAPKLEIKTHDAQRLASGYWFMAPYGKNFPKDPATGRQPYHVGPFIYDQDGTLIWAGPSMFENENVYDFKVAASPDETPRLSFIVKKPIGPFQGKAIILDQEFNIVSELDGPKDIAEFDIHEFTVLPGGKTALACAHWPKEMDLGDFGRPNDKSFFVTAGFFEFDMATGERLAWWDASAPGNIGIHETVLHDGDIRPLKSPGHDYLHLNSVDKNADGLYLVSMRFTNTIYLASGTENKIIWRLGGKESDFDQDFNFTKQHDARFLESNATHHVISFLNNAADDQVESESVSSALIVALDTTTSPMTARLLHRYNRPDDQLSRLRGNVQLLPNENVFVGWSDDGYMTEFSPEGDVLIEAKHQAKHFYTYRSYKFDFVGKPSAPPDLIALLTQSEGQAFTSIHVSWNGATEVASWRFYTQPDEDRSPLVLGSVPKSNFETKLIVSGHFDWITAEAFDHAGASLGKSRVFRTNSKDNQPSNGPAMATKSASIFATMWWKLPFWVAVLAALYWLSMRLRPMLYSFVRQHIHTSPTAETWYR